MLANHKKNLKKLKNKTEALRLWLVSPLMLLNSLLSVFLQKMFFGEFFGLFVCLFKEQKDVYAVLLNTCK